MQLIIVISYHQPHINSQFYYADYTSVDDREHETAEVGHVGPGSLIRGTKCLSVHCGVRTRHVSCCWCFAQPAELTRSVLFPRIDSGCKVVQ